MVMCFNYYEMVLESKSRPWFVLLVIFVVRMTILFSLKVKKRSCLLNGHIGSSIMLTIENVMVIMFGAHGVGSWSHVNVALFRP